MKEKVLGYFKNKVPKVIAPAKKRNPTKLKKIAEVLEVLFSFKEKRFLEKILL
jgi:hypothetical protein